MTKRFLLAVMAIAVTTGAAIAAETAPDAVAVKPDAKVERLIHEALPLCENAKFTWEAMKHKLPANLTGTVVQVDAGTASSCSGMYLAVTSTAGSFYLGLPWFLDDETGTLEERLKHFTWERMQESFDAVVERTKTRDGLYPAILYQTTERGKLPIEGEIDPTGSVFFFGHFRPMAEDFRANRLKAFDKYVAASPTKGAATPAVTVIEFSDFECPSCRHAAGYLTPILSKYGDKVRYVRYDMPLIANHPWALAAALCGRAIHRQKPELFWDYKNQVYANQDSLSAFTIYDFARGFAQDHDLNLEKYDADVASEELKKELIKGVGVGLSNDIRATPTYIVNGTMVDAGPDGKALETYVASLLK